MVTLFTVVRLFVALLQSHQRCKEHCCVTFIVAAGLSLYLSFFFRNIFTVPALSKSALVSDFSLEFCSDIYAKSVQFNEGPVQRLQTVLMQYKYVEKDLRIDTNLSIEV